MKQNITSFYLVRLARWGFDTAEKDAPVWRRLRDGEYFVFATSRKEAIRCAEKAKEIAAGKRR